MGQHRCAVHQTMQNVHQGPIKASKCLPHDLLTGGSSQSTNWCVDVVITARCGTRWSGVRVQDERGCGDGTTYLEKGDLGQGAGPAWLLVSAPELQFMPHFFEQMVEVHSRK